MVEGGRFFAMVYNVLTAEGHWAVQGGGVFFNKGFRFCIFFLAVGVSDNRGFGF